MPIYEYGCYDCRKRVNVFFRTFTDAETKAAVCPLLSMRASATAGIAASTLPMAGTKLSRNATNAQSGANFTPSTSRIA